MATATTNVQLNVTGNAAQQLQKVQTSVDKLGKSFGSLRNLLGGIAIGALVTNMFRAADAMTDLSDATNLTVGSILALRQAFELSGGDAEGAEQAILKLTGSIQEAASGNDKLITAFDKVGVSLQDLGTLSEEEITNKVIAGLANLGNGTEAVAIKMELMGKKARGVDVKKLADQFNTLKTSMKDVEPGIKAAGQIFDNMTKLKGELGTAFAKQFGDILAVIADLTNDTKKFAATVAFLAKAFLLLGVPILTYTRGLRKIKEVNDDVYRSIIVLNRSGFTNLGFNLKNLRYIILNVVGAMKNLLGVFSINRIVQSTAAFLGFGKALKGILNTSYGMTAFWNLFQNLFKIFARLGPIIGTVWLLKDALDALFGVDVIDTAIDKVKEFFGLLMYQDANAFKGMKDITDYTIDDLEEVTSKAGETRDRLKDIREENERFMESVRDITKEYRQQNAELLQSLGNEIKYLTMTEEQIALDKNRIAINKEFMNTLDELGKKRREAMADPSKGAGVVSQIDAEIKKVQESAAVTQSESAKKIKAYYAEVAALKDVQTAIEDTQRIFAKDEALQALQDELSLIGLYGKELEKQKTIMEAEKALRQEMQALSIDLLKLEADRAKIGEEAYQKERARVVQQMMDVKTLTEAKIAAYEEEVAKKQKIDESYSEGVKRALDDIADQYKPINMAQDAIKKGWGAIENAVDTFVDTGKFKFADFARSVIADLAKMIAKAMIFKAISAALGAFGLKLPGLAGGGPVEAGKGYLVGEKGPELFVPPGSGKIVPNKDLQGNSKGTGQVSAPITNNYNTYNINALDAKSVAQVFAENRKAIFGANKMAEREMSYAGAR